MKKRIKKPTSRDIEQKIEQFSQAFAQLPDPILITDTNYNITSVNKSFEEMYGYTLEELVGEIPGMLNVEPMVENIQREIYNTINNGIWRGSALNRKKDGSTFFCDMTISALKDEQGEPFAYVGTQVDITEKNNILKDLEQKKMFLENITDIAYTTDTNGNITYINPAIESIAGVKPKELIGRPFLPLFIEKNHSSLIDIYTKTLQGVKNQQNNLTFTNGVGCHFSSEPLQDEEGNVIGTFGIARDITKRLENERFQKVYEEEVKNKTQLLETILDNSIVGFALNKIDTGEVIYVSDAFLKAYNISRADCTSVDSFFETVYGDRMEFGLEMKNDVLSEDVSRMNWPDIPIMDEQGNMTYVSGSNMILKEQNLMISTVFDSTERKRAEKALINTHRLSAIGELAAGVAHDFNNALQTIFGSLELSLLENITPETREYIETAKKSAIDAASRVRQLQRFSGKNESSLEYSDVNLSEVVEDTIIQTRTLWKDESQRNGIDITIKTDYAPGLNVFGNQGELRSVLYNLIKNSVHAMPEGGTINIGTRKDKENLYLTVTDTGIGMDEEVQKRIFQPFFTTKGFEQGKGLGMSGAYSIIKEHLGYIYIKKSAPDEGTTFELKFPYTERKIHTEKKIETGYSGSARVLWVDDEESIRELEKMLLTKMGYETDVASSGQEALELLTKNSYDLMITDIGMPGMNGWQLAEQVKEKYSEMKIAVATGWGDDVSTGQKQKYNIGYVLGKPVSQEKVRNVINEVIQMKKV